MSVLEASTGSLHWEMAGSADAPGLILVHSLGSDTRMWNDQLDALTAMRRVVWVDLPGHGRSTAVDRDYTVDDLGGDIAAVADAAGFDVFDICGVSLGGLISMWVAANHPDRVRRLVACSTAPRVGTAEMWSERMAGVREGGLASMSDAIVPRFVTPDLGERRPEANALVYEMFVDIDDIGYLGCCAALRDADITASIGGITAPTLVIAGAVDVATPPDVMEPIQNAVAGSRMEVVKDAAHLVNIDQPDEFNSLVTRFLRF